MYIIFESEMMLLPKVIKISSCFETTTCQSWRVFFWDAVYSVSNCNRYIIALCW